MRVAWSLYNTGQDYLNLNSMESVFDPDAVDLSERRPAGV